MTRLRSVPILLTGAALGIALVLSCSDDIPPDADAAVCDCPAAEPPIVAGRLVYATNTNSIAPGITTGQGALCPSGVALSGSCRLTDVATTAPDLVITQSGYAPAPGAEGWSCEWQNNSPGTTYTVTVQVRCLVPAQ